MNPQAVLDGFGPQASLEGSWRPYWRSSGAGGGRLRYLPESRGGCFGLSPRNLPSDLGRFWAHLMVQNPESRRAKLRAEVLDRS